MFRNYVSDLNKFLKTKPGLEEFIINVMVIVVALSLAFVINFKESRASLDVALKDSQAILINIITQEIFAGKIFDDPIEVKQGAVDNSAASIPTEKDVEDSVNANVQKAPVVDGLPKIAVIVMDLGLSKNVTIDALDLPQNITLGFSAYASNLEDWLEQADARGFETLLNLPMQPYDYQVNDPGPYSLLVNLSNGENLSRLDLVANKSNKFIGFYTGLNEVFSSSQSSLSPVVEEIKKKNLRLIFGNKENKQIVNSLADIYKFEIKIVTNQVDAALDQVAIKASFEELEVTAKNSGYAIGLIRPYPVSLDSLKKWSQDLQSKGIMLVKVSDLFTTPRIMAKDIREIIPTPPPISLPKVKSNNGSKPSKAKGAE